MKTFAFILKNVDAAYLLYGGEGRVIYNLILSLIQEGYVVDVYCNTLKKDVEIPGIRDIVVFNKPLKRKSKRHLLQFYQNVMRAMTDKPYDYILSREPIPPTNVLFTQCHSLKHFETFTEPILLSLLFRFTKYRRLQFERSIFKKYLGGLKTVLVVSEKLQNDLFTNFAIDKNMMNILHPGIDIADSFPLELKKNKIPVIGLSATGIKNKGGYILLAALRNLHYKGYPFKAKIIYPNYKKNYLIQLMHATFDLKEKVEFIPFQENMNSFYESIDVITMPSTFETFGLVALEAMAKGKPAIVSLNTGVSEIVQDGVNGFTFEMKNAEKNLTEKLEIFLNNYDKYDMYSQEAFKTALEQRWESVYDRFKKILDI